MALKILKKATSLAEALQIQAFLQSHGIECDVPNRTSDTYFNYFTSPRVWVAEEDYQTAKKLLDDLETPVRLVEEESVDWEAKYLNRALGAAILSIFLPVIANLYSIYLLLKVNPDKKVKYMMIWLVNFLSLYVFFQYVKVNLHPF